MPNLAYLPLLLLFGTGAFARQTAGPLSGRAVLHSGQGRAQSGRSAVAAEPVLMRESPGGRTPVPAQGLSTGGILVPARDSPKGGTSVPVQGPSAGGMLVPARDSPGGNGVLEQYIRLGLDSNLALHQRNFDLERSRLDLKRARSLFYPQAGFSSQYTLANGGRSIDIPIGDLLNGAYSTLNQLTNTKRFPQVANQSVQFLPNDYHDTKMEVTLPILNTDLQHNREINRETIGVRQADRDVYRRDLVRSIRQAYYQYLQSGKAVEIYTTALSLVKENRRVSGKFVENHMATREIVLRAQAQVSEVEASLIEAENQRKNAAAYFNFLLKRSLDSDVVTDSSLMAPGVDEVVDPAGGGAAGGVFASDRASSGGTVLLSRREEFDRVRSYQRITASNLKWDRAYLVPKLNAFYDVGFQGYGFHPNGSQFYQLAGIQLVWPLFKAGDNKLKIRQAEIDMASLDEQYKQLTRQVSLERETTVNNYRSALEALRSLSDGVSSAREAYRLAERRFNEGQALQIELIDARTQLTNSEIRYSVGRLAVLNRAADLERVTASYKF
ncbi:MAG: TolC family protein [Bacteroidetes bacterium]|nr:TolC family protein [Bacteroidota bacterium]